MKVVDICLCGSYNIGWGYQDNLLSKYQLKNGNAVTVVTSSFINDKNSDGYLAVPAGLYEDSGVKVIRLKNGLSPRMTKLFRHYKGLFAILNSEAPDFIFVHGCQFIDIVYVCKYLKKHPNVKCVVDNHADFTNSAQSKLAYFVHKTLWKYCASRIDKYAQKFYGVLPVRCEFIHKMYGIDNSKIDLLVMGADDELLQQAIENSENTRKKYRLDAGTFLIISGGKIDEHKAEVLTLMQAINNFDVPNVKLVIFGSVADSIKSDFNDLLSDKIQYTGWLNQQEIYDLICASDLGFFPGRHSVIWEQVVAAGIPSIFRKLPKTDHVDIGGNCLFLEDVSYASVMKILDFVTNKNNYAELKEKAMSKDKNKFLYSQIAEKSLETASLDINRV